MYAMLLSFLGYLMPPSLGGDIRPLMIEFHFFRPYLIKLSGGIFMLKLLLLTSRLFVRNLTLCFFIRSAIHVHMYSTICFPLLDCTVTIFELDLITYSAAKRFSQVSKFFVQVAV